MDFYGIFFSGFYLGLGLIVAIGAQNAYVIRQGLSGRHFLSVAFFCSFWDAFLIFSGTFGFRYVKQHPEIFTTVRIAGVLFISYYAIASFRRAFGTNSMNVRNDSLKDKGAVAAIKTALAFSMLNPHVYLDTFFLVGTYSAKYDYPLNYLFATGAVLASFTWFYSISIGASKLAPYLQNPLSWKIIDSVIGIIMLYLAYNLAVS